MISECNRRRHPVYSGLVIFYGDKRLGFYKRLYMKGEESKGDFAERVVP